MLQAYGEDWLGSPLVSRGQKVRFCLLQALYVQEVFSFKARSTSTFAISTPAGHGIHGWIWKRKAYKELLWEGLPVEGLAQASNREEA